MGEERPMKIIIDTDIADDIDDAIALAFALGSPEFDILGVTVVYGDVETRAQVARKLIRSWRRELPVKVGLERPLGFEWFPGTEPEPCSQRPAVDGEPPLEDASRTAPQFIADCARRHPGEVTVVTLGAMTNVGAALCAEPELADLLAGVVSVAGGGLPRRHRGLDWNVAYDVTAARVLARSSVRWTIIGWNVLGVHNSLRTEQFDALAASGLPSARLLLELIVLMKRNKSGQDPSVRTIRDVKSASTCDVTALAALLDPGRLDLRPGRIEVDADVGCLSFIPEDSGPHRCARANHDAPPYRDEILRRLLSAPR